ncbi:MAG: TonB family protein [Gemmatimonadetes bacterium]|nr:TonB family protein [Gemmatimonadota bacterium]
MNRTFLRALHAPVARRLLTALALMCALPMLAQAQDAKKIYELSEVDALPKLSSPSYTSRLISEAYPDNLRRAGVGGAVQMELVVDASGKVDASQIDAVSTVPQLIEVAKQVAPKLEFTPAKVKGTAVKSRVVLPLVFKP